MASKILTSPTARAEPLSPKRAAALGQIRKYSIQGLIPAVSALSFVNALAVASRLAQTSDSAQSFVTAHAVDGGNLLLSGWHFPVDDYYFTDTLPYAAFELVVGSRPFLLTLVPALTYALFVVAALLSSARPSQSASQNLLAAAAFSLLLGVPAWTGLWNPFLLSNMHAATVLGSFVALAICAGLAEQKHSAIIIWAALPFIVLPTVASDPFAIVFAYGPACPVLVISFVRKDAPRALPALAVLGCAIAVGAALPFAISALGGFTVENDVSTNFIPAHLLVRNFHSVLAGLLVLSGITPVVQSGAPGLLLLFFRGMGLLLVAASIVRVARQLFGRAPLLDRFLFAGIVTDLIACALSAQFAKGIPVHAIWLGGPPMRFLMPAVLFATVLAGRQTPAIISAWRSEPMRRTATAFVIACGALMLVTGAWLSGTLSQPRWILDNPPAAAAQWLEMRGLSQGAGEYWSANLLTAMSGNRVQVRSVIPVDGRLVPYVWVEDAHSYVKAPQFMIWQNTNKTHVTLAQVRASFPVCRVEAVAEFRVAMLDPACRSNS